MGAKQDDVETSHANLLAYSRAMEQTGDALVANRAFPNEARLTGAKIKLKSIRDRVDLEPTAFDQFLAAADKLEQEDPKSTIPQLAAFARFETVSNAPQSTFANPKIQLDKTVDALVRLANVEPPLPETADLLEHFGLVTELRDDPKKSMMLFELLGKRFPEHPLIKFVPGSVHRLELRGKPITDVQGKDFDGKPVDVKDFRGKIVLVDFWASWCKPCIEEMRDLKEMRRALEPMGFEIIGVCIDEDARQAQFAVESMKIPWPQIYDQRGPEGFSSKLALALGIGKIPHKLIITPDGVLAASGVDLGARPARSRTVLEVQAKKKLAEMKAAKEKTAAAATRKKVPRARRSR